MSADHICIRSYIHLKSRFWVHIRVDVYPKSRFRVHIRADVYPKSCFCHREQGVFNWLVALTTSLPALLSFIFSIEILLIRSVLFCQAAMACRTRAGQSSVSLSHASRAMLFAFSIQSMIFVTSSVSNPGCWLRRNLTNPLSGRALHYGDAAHYQAYSPIPPFAGER